jgi:Ni/Fe-hydrogenase subunit HybB-like protein
MSKEYEIIKRKIITKPFLFFLGLFLIGMYFVAERFLKGIGAVSALSDGYPWGVWITYDVVTAMALACGGYSLSLLVYAFNNWKYHPLVRAGLLTGAFGYTLGGLAVIIDLGRYWNMWEFFVPWKHWNVNSVLLEVAICVMTYTTVLWLELSPAFVERLGVSEEKKEKINKFLNKLLLFLIIPLGMTLPTMHQSSLGSLQLISTVKLSPMWHTILLPLLFLISCIAMGYAIVVAESLLSSLFFKRPYETHLLKGLAKLVAFLGLVWITIRFVDLAYRGQLGNVLNSGMLTISFVIEILLFAIPSILFLFPKFRSTPRKLFVLAFLFLLGGCLYRFNVFLIGWDPGNNWVYFPSVPELMITIGIVSLEVLLYLIFVKTFPILPKVHKSHA